MDFFKIRVKEPKGKNTAHEVYPDFIVGKCKDLMVKGGTFHAIWDEERGFWSAVVEDVVQLVDREVQNYADNLSFEGTVCEVKTLSSYDSGRWDKFLKFLRSLSDNYHDLDAKLTFANTDLKKTDYATRRLPYPLERGPHPAYDELVGTLYNEEERTKFEWAIGAVISGDSRSIQKFLVFHGAPGTGKSTVMNVIEMLCEGYSSAFDASALVSNGSTFGLEAFKDNPIVAIQHDGDLSRIEDNTRLNSIVSHEKMRINEKFKPTYDSKVTSFLFMGTNNPVRITNSNSGLIRRLIDVYPSGETHELDRYNHLMAQIPFELGAIAHHCLDLYKRLGKGYYKAYKPTAMLFMTNVMANFVDAYYDVFKEQDGATLKQAYSLYKEYCDEANIEFKLPMHRFRDDLKRYFAEFLDRSVINGVHVRSYFRGFTAEPFKTPVEGDVTKFKLVLEETESLLDTMLADCIAQYAKADGTPKKFWDDSERLIKGIVQKPDPKAVVDTVLSDLDTSKLHYVKVPENHIVIDFDLVDEDGNKSLDLNKTAASEFPSTYAEVSKGGEGVHLHYIWGGDVDELASVFSEGIEIKVYRDNAGLRRKLSLCNNVPVATISSGLPLKEKKMLAPAQLRSEKGLRDMIARNLNKDIHPSTKSSIDFIEKILDDAYKDGLEYDVTDLQPRVMAFAQNSTNQAIECLRIFKRMKFSSEGREEGAGKKADIPVAKDDRLVFFDVEVYPNLLVICWKYQGSPDVVRMINPSAVEVESLFQFKLVGFYNRPYDNHIIMARAMGYPIEKIYELSQALITDKDNAKTFGQAYSLSYADVYDFSSIKQSLKKWMIELGLDHIEMGIPWDKPVPPELIPVVVEYCVNDVIGTEAVFEAREADFVARQILADLSGLTVNDTTQKHAAKIIFGGRKNAQDDFVYTELAKDFPGYEFNPYSKDEKSTYRGEVVGEGGYVYSEPGMYRDVALLDIASMHPTSIKELNAFGVHTDKFWAMVQARLAIKKAGQELKDGRPEMAETYLDEARGMLDGKLAPYLKDVRNTQGLSDALKIVINIVYGLTSAVFSNPFKDPRNIDNIVAKRGALFMIDLKHAVQDRGFTAAHIKTDSIKIPGATQEIIEFVMKFGEKYGYTFEHEATYDKFCLVNDAVYIAKKGDKWDAVGAEFKEPYVFKTMFSGDPIAFDDVCQTKSVVKGAIYLAPEEVLEETKAKKGTTKSPLTEEQLEKMQFVGKHGRFTPVTKETGGRVLVRVQDGKPYAVTGTKGYYWAESVVVQKINEIDSKEFDVGTAHKPGGFEVDLGYFQEMAKNARETIDRFGGGYTELVS